ncbi:hypothetical protein ACXO2W_09070, partial [Lactobacillus delbrueckii subsp. bulgaricus]
LVYSLFLKGQISLFIRFIIDTAGRVVIGRGLVSFGNIKNKQHFRPALYFFVRKQPLFRKKFCKTFLLFLAQNYKTAFQTV